MRLKGICASAAAIVLALAGLLLLPAGPTAQPATTGGPWFRPNCTTLTNPTAANLAACWDTTRGYLNGWDGTGWQSDAANSTKVVNAADPRWGVKCDNVTDDRAAIQAAYYYAQARRYILQLPPGQCKLLSAGPTVSGKVTGLLFSNQTAVDANVTQGNHVTVRGAGFYATQIVAANSLADHIVHVSGIAEGIVVENLLINLSGTATADAIYVNGNGGEIRNVATGGAGIGLHAFGLSTNPIYYHFDEFSATGMLIEESWYLQIYSPIELQNTTFGIQVKATQTGLYGALIEDQVLTGIDIVGGVSAPGNTGIGLNVNTPATTKQTVNVFGTHLGDNGTVASFHAAYGFSVTDAYALNLIGLETFGTKNGSFITQGTVTITGSAFNRDGMHDQSTPFAVRSLEVDGGTVSVMNSLFRGCAGHAVWFKNTAEAGASLTLLENTFDDCSNGGLTAGLARVSAANATTGAENVYIAPQDTAVRVTIRDNKFTAPAGQSAGKTALRLDGTTAVPAAGNVLIEGNTAVSGRFANNFVATALTAAQMAGWVPVYDALVNNSITFAATGVQLGAPTGGDKGVGTINASSYYVHGTAIASMPLTNASGTITNAPHLVQDTVTLTGGTAGVALAGAAAFTNSTSYTCVCDNDSAVLACRVVQNGGNGFTVSSGAGTDVVRFICAGN